MRFHRTAIATAGALAVVGASAALAVGPMASAAPNINHSWSATWTTAMQQAVPGGDPAAPNWSTQGFASQTVRQVVRVSDGGSRVRIRLSNKYGATPLHIAGATIGESAGGAAIRPGSLRNLTFHGSRSTSIATGQVESSDAASLKVSPLESLTVTLYFATPTGPASFHEDGLTTSYRADGDHRTDLAAGAFDATSRSFYYLTGVDVQGVRTSGAVVAFGDSITNGHNSTVGANQRYTDALAARLVQAHRPGGVVNVGISGNLLLSELPCFGASGVDRFRQDALRQPGVRTVVLLEGSNDIWDSEQNFGCGVTSRVTAEQLIAGYRTLIDKAHARGVRVIGATILPFNAPYIEPADFARAEAIRVQVNNWILTSGAYDGVVDSAKAVADPADPRQLNPAYNSGDFLHPNDAGYAAIADAFDLAQL